jgi:hypothetical protein
MHGDDVERDHLGLVLGVELVHPPVGARVGAVAQADDGLLRVAHRVDEPLARRRLAQVGRNDEDAHAAMAAHLVGDDLQTIRPPRDDHEVVAEAAELARELGADARGRPGDQDGGVESWCWQAHGGRP